MSDETVTEDCLKKYFKNQLDAKNFFVGTQFFWPLPFKACIPCDGSAIICMSQKLKENFKSWWINSPYKTVWRTLITSCYNVLIDSLTKWFTSYHLWFIVNILYTSHVTFKIDSGYITCDLLLVSSIFM